MRNERKKHLRRKYNMTESEYDWLLKEQNGRCAICYREPKGRRLAVDHNHRTGKIRGLLCGKCNAGLGLFDESIDVLKEAARYLWEQ